MSDNEIYVGHEFCEGGFNNWVVALASGHDNDSIFRGRI